MQAAGLAIRVFGSGDRYGEQPREAPIAKPLEAANFPRKDDRCMLWFGGVPNHIQEACRLRDAMASALLTQMVGTAPATDYDAAVDRLVGDTALGFDDREWYVTLVLQRPVELDEEQLTDARYYWIDPRALEAVDEALRAEAPATFELIVAAIAPILGDRFFEDRSGRDRFLVVADGRTPVFFPRLSGSAELSIGKSMNNFPLDALRDRIAELEQHGQSWRPWLRRVAYWSVAMLETDDPWKRFQWGFLALEVLTNKLVDRLRGRAMQALELIGAHGGQAPSSVIERLVWEKERMPLASRFALVAAYLSPATADEDLAAFRAVRTARDAMAHGEPVVVDELPANEVQALLYAHGINFFPPSGIGNVSDLVVKSNGSIAWTQSEFTATVRLADTRGVRVPRNGHDVRAGSLRLRDSQLTWKKNRRKFSNPSLLTRCHLSADRRAAESAEPLHPPLTAHDRCYASHLAIILRRGPARGHRLSARAGGRAGRSRRSTLSAAIAAGHARARHRRCAHLLQRDERPQHRV